MGEIDYNAVILAGGFSSRAGGFKPLFKIGDSTLIERAVSPFLKICTKVIVVIGYKGEEIESIFRGNKKVKIIENENFSDGMFSSIKVGVKEVESKRFFLTPGDYPFIDIDICKKLMDNEGQVVVPSFNYKKGHPILLNSSYKNDILESEDSSLREFLKDKTTSYVVIEHEGILKDIDTKMDYIEVLNKVREEQSGEKKRYLEFHSKR